MQSLYYSLSSKYRLEIERTDVGGSKGSIYSNDEFLTSLQSNRPNFPFLFVQHEQREFIIACCEPSKYILINLWTGHYVENETEGSLIWEKFWQIDDATICVKGRVGHGFPYIYQFYDINRDGLTKLQVKGRNGSELPKTHYILTDCDIGKDQEYSDPIIEDHVIKFCVCERRVVGFGIKNSNNDIDDIDMTVGEYEEQMNRPDGSRLIFYKDKIKRFIQVQMIYQRISDCMVLILYWERGQKNNNQSKNLSSKMVSLLGEKSKMYWFAYDVSISDKVKSFVYLYSRESWNQYFTYVIEIYAEGRGAPEEREAPEAPEEREGEKDHPLYKLTYYDTREDLESSLEFWDESLLAMYIQ
jgi:hypothetical protein